MCFADCTSTLPLQSAVSRDLRNSALPLNGDEAELQVEPQHRDLGLFLLPPLLLALGVLAG